MDSCDASKQVQVPRNGVDEVHSLNLHLSCWRLRQDNSVIECNMPSLWRPADLNKAVRRIVRSRASVSWLKRLQCLLQWAGPDLGGAALAGHGSVVPGIKRRLIGVV
jgi:hypothetical protein